MPSPFIFASSPAAPVVVTRITPPCRALLVRPYDGPTAWTDSAGVRAVDVLGLDARPDVATRALIEMRDGSALRKGWVPVADLASTPALAAEKLASHFSALLAAAQRPAKMPVTTTTASEAEAKS